MKLFRPPRPLLPGILLSGFFGVCAFAATPVLTCKVVDQQAALTWPLSGDSYVLESSPDLSPGMWPVVLTEPIRSGGNLSLALPLEPKSCFFRLRWSNVPARVYVVVNETDEDLRQVVRGSYGMPTNDPSPAGALLSFPLSAAFGNVFSAGGTTVPGTDDSKLSYEWKISYPENRNGGVVYIDHLSRIQGVNTSQLTLLANALPNLGNVAGENEWRTVLTVTNNAGPTPQVTQFRFRFRYVGSGLVN